MIETIIGVASTATLVFCGRRLYLAGLKKGFDKGSKNVINEWRKWLREEEE